MITPLYVPLNFHTSETVIMWQRPYFGCVPFYDFEDGLFCPVKWEIV